mgnify:CR=1 FL=1
MGKYYEQMTMTRLTLSLEGTVLTGSLTSVPIKINEVTVEDYSAGFHEGVSGELDFKDITFD